MSDNAGVFHCDDDRCPCPKPSRWFQSQDEAAQRSAEWLAKHEKDG